VVWAVEVSSDKSQRERITIRLAVSAANRRHDGEDEHGEAETNQQWKSDAYKGKEGAAQDVKKNGNMKIKRFLGMKGHCGGRILLYQVDDQWQQNGQTKKDGKVTKDDPKLVVAFCWLRVFNDWWGHN
jgi:hypothetical protein